MARIAYFDCFSGISGDMVLGALLDLGLPLDRLRSALGSLAIDVGEVTAERVLRAGVSATKFRLAPDVPETAGTMRHQAHPPDHQPHRESADAHGHVHQHRTLTEIIGHIERSALSPSARRRAVQLFRRMAEAEAAIHDMPLEKVHLHEVGALDSIVDIVGAVDGLEWLAAEAIVASPLNVGSGTVVCAHGTFPVPAPATARLLIGVPVYAGEIAQELVTPTGALLATEYARDFGPLPPMRVDAIGYGAGDRDVKGHPNVLRIVVGHTLETHASEPIVVVECEIDDMNPQLFGPLMDRLYVAGALDVFYSAIQMKKNRPGTLVTVITQPEQREAVTGLLFTETTTIGVRYQEIRRERLDRDIRSIDTPLGPVRFKVAVRDGRVVNASPEFEDCVQAAAERGIPVKEVQAIAMKAWLDRGHRPGGGEFLQQG